MGLRLLLMVVCSQALQLSRRGVCRSSSSAGRRRVVVYASEASDSVQEETAAVEDEPPPKAPLDAKDALPELKAPVEGKQVRMFGAKLDAGLAGTRAVSRAVIQEVLQNYKDGNSTDDLASQDDLSTIFYGAAVDTMNRGKYDDAVKRSTAWNASHLRSRVSSP